MTNPDNYPRNDYGTTPDPAPVEPPVEPASNTQVEEFTISGDTLMSRVQELLHESNIRRILLKNENGQVLLDIPLTAGIVGGAVGITFFTPLVAVGAIAGMLARLTLVVERRV
ncbi:MAG: DUF4342 domain-containing protein [Leptolyngbya sp. SIO4C1]|nr:DUF4342 domain-containing protein [Leptolyngbya sp. SIO4C1]